MVEFEFHVSKNSRQKYNFDQALFGLDGRAVIADFAAARRFAESMSLVRGQVVPASDINAMGLIDEIQHILFRQYELQNPGIMSRALANASPDVALTLLKFIQEFPPMSVQRGEVEASRYLEMHTAGRPNRQAAIEELLILHITNLNPATQPYRELFDEAILKQASPYDQTVNSLKAFFNSQPGFGDQAKTGKNESLIDALLAPARVAPHSLTAQLEFLLTRWGGLLGEAFVMRILRGIDFVQRGGHPLHRAGRFRRAGPGDDLWRSRLCGI